MSRVPPPINSLARSLGAWLAVTVASLLAPAIRPADAQQSVWQIWNYYGACQFGSTTNCCPPIEEPGPWGPSGWPGTVWWGWDCEVLSSSSQYCYVSCDAAPAGHGLVGRHWFRVYQSSTFNVTLTAASNNSFTRLTASLRRQDGVAIVAVNVEPQARPQQLLQQLTLAPGTYELRVESPSIAGGPRSGPCTARVDFVSTDGDGDGTPDSEDGCSLDPNKTAPGVCGCGSPDIDSDRDGVLDCLDGCPQDPWKVSPGQCGCAAAETDSDGDGTADCVDLCPLDPQKASPGLCGCGIAESDADADGRVDCIDNCPGVFNPSQVDCDADGLGDACDPGADHNSNGIPDYCECIADLAVDGRVGGDDLGILLVYWGPTTSAPFSQRSDMNRDGHVNGDDLGYLLTRWGPCTN